MSGYKSPEWKVNQREITLQEVSPTPEQTATAQELGENEIVQLAAKLAITLTTWGVELSRVPNVQDVICEVLNSLHSSEASSLAKLLDGITAFMSGDPAQLEAVESFKLGVIRALENLVSKVTSESFFRDPSTPISQLGLALKGYIDTKQSSGANNSLRPKARGKIPSWIVPAASLTFSALLAAFGALGNTTTNTARAQVDPTVAATLPPATTPTGGPGTGSTSTTEAPSATSVPATSTTVPATSTSVPSTATTGSTATTQADPTVAATLPPATTPTGGPGTGSTATTEATGTATTEPAPSTVPTIGEPPTPTAGQGGGGTPTNTPRPTETATPGETPTNTPVSTEDPTKTPLPNETDEPRRENPAFCPAVEATAAYDGGKVPASVFSNLIPAGGIRGNSKAELEETLKFWLDINRAEINARLAAYAGDRANVRVEGVLVTGEQSPFTCNLIFTGDLPTGETPTANTPTREPVVPTPEPATNTPLSVVSPTSTRTPAVPTPGGDGRTGLPPTGAEAVQAGQQNNGVAQGVGAAALALFAGVVGWFTGKRKR